MGTFTTFLECYPFNDERITLVEGFSAYDGNLKDEPGTPHKGIDYVLVANGHYVGFDVFSMHAGEAVQGLSKSWGKYVLLKTHIDGQQYATIYAHFRKIDERIPLLDPEHPKPGILVPASSYIGRAGITGWTNRLTQLHIELHRKNPETGALEKLDPYGIYDRRSSERYPQPGEPLKGLAHYWTTNAPPFARG